MEQAQNAALMMETHVLQLVASCAKQDFLVLTSIALKKLLDLQKQPPLRGSRSAALCSQGVGLT